MGQGVGSSALYSAVSAVGGRWHDLAIADILLAVSMCIAFMWYDARQRELIVQQYEDLKVARRRAVQRENLVAVGRLASSVAHEVRNPLGVIRSSTPHRYHSAYWSNRRHGPSTGSTFASKTIFASRPTRICWFKRCKTWWRTRLRSVTRSGFRPPSTTARSSFECWTTGSACRRSSENSSSSPYFTTKTSGTGLGLPMARKIVELHDGHIEYRDDEGLGPDDRGACFEVRIPR